MDELPQLWNVLKGEDELERYGNKAEAYTPGECLLIPGTFADRMFSWMGGSLCALQSWYLNGQALAEFEVRKLRSYVTVQA